MMEVRISGYVAYSERVLHNGSGSVLSGKHVRRGDRLTARSKSPSQPLQVFEKQVSIPIGRFRNDLIRWVWPADDTGTHMDVLVF